MFRLRRVERFTDINVVTSKLVPGFFLDPSEAADKARELATAAQASHTSLKNGVYDYVDGSGSVAKFKYGKSVAYRVVNKGRYY
jgi:hypothetical protein